MRRTIIKPAALVDGTGGPVSRRPAVVVEDARIAWVGPSASLAEDVDAEVISAPEQTLLPGLIDAHVHLVCSGQSATARQFLAIRDEDLLFAAVANAQAALLAGVTTIRDLGSRGSLVINVRDAIDDGRLTGPRILAAGPAITTTGGHFHYFGVEADTADQAVAAVRAHCKNGVDLIKIMATGGNSTTGSNPLRPQYTVEQIGAVVQDAHRLGRRVTAHVHGVEGIKNAVQAGVDCLEHCSWLGLTGTEYDPRLADEIARKGIFVSLAMPARYRLPLDVTDTRVTPEQRATNLLRASRFAATRDMHARGIQLVASSDAGMVMTHIGDFALTLEMVVSQLGLSPLDAIIAATATAAAALGIADEVGTVVPGKRADLVLVDGDPLEDIGALRRARRVFRDGRTVALDGLLASAA